MASSAAQISVSTGAPMQAPHGKAHNKTPGGDVFAEMLAGTQEENVRAPARDSSAKAADSEKPASKDPAPQNEAAATKETAKAPAEGRAETAQTAQEAQPASDGKAQTAAANDNAQSDESVGAIDANDGGNENTGGNETSLVDVAAALPRAAEPAPAPQQPAPVMMLTPQPSQVDAQPAPEGQANSAEADIAPVSGNAPAKAAPQLPEARNTQNGQPLQAADKPAAPETAPAGAKDAATATQTAAGVHDFSKALQETKTNPQEAQPAPAVGETAKPAEPAAPATPRPSPDTNSVALATPAAPTHQPPALPGAERLAMTAQAAPQEAPQAAPNVNQMAVEVAARSQSGAKQFEIRLDPPELGRVEVRLSIDAHGKAEAHLTADQPQTLELLQKDAPSLARALRDAGLNVAQDALNFSLKNQQGHAGGDDAQRQGGRGNFPNNPRPAAEQPESGTYVRRGLGLLDIKV